MNWFNKTEHVCDTYEVLKQQLAFVQQQNQYLLDKLLNPIQSGSPENAKEEESKPLVPKHIPWSVKRQMLEEEDRAKAKVIRENLERERESKVNLNKIKEDIKDLETELGVLPVEDLKVDNAS